MGFTPRTNPAKARFMLRLPYDLAERLWAHCRASQIDPGTYVRLLVVARCRLPSPVVKYGVPVRPMTADKHGYVRLGVPCTEPEEQAVWERTRSEKRKSTSELLIDFVRSAVPTCPNCRNRHLPY